MLIERIAHSIRGKFGIALMALLLSSGGIYGCEKQEGPAERAGKAIDNAAEKAGEKIEEAGEKIQETAKGTKSNSVNGEVNGEKN